MKTSVAVIVAAASMAMATPQKAGLGPINCLKPNAAFCNADLIVRCDANAIGITGRCSDNVAGYPPAGGVASCWESDKLAGDAACVKNCVVYADKPFTLPASQCTPSYTATSGPSSTPPPVVTTTVGSNSTKVITSCSTTPAGTTVIPPKPSSNSTGVTGTNVPPKPTGPPSIPSNAAAGNAAAGALALVGVVAAFFI